MLSKRLSAVGLLLLALFLTGCGGSVSTDLYVQDIIEVVEGLEEPLFTSSTISVESPGDEYNAELIELLERNFRDVRNARTESKDYSTYVLVDVKVPILILEDYEQLWENDEAIGIIVVDMEDGSAAFGVALNSDKLDSLFGAFMDQLWDSASIEDFTFSVKLYNDTRDPVFASLQGVYANGVPIAYEEVYEMARRDVMEIRLGDVARDVAYQDGLVIIGVVE
ncbi:MAG TPA: hypothetical protein VJZ70_05375 [Limnochordia bacterium]|nr:hypothetical protein [Limnochordia bacterium]